MVIDSLIGKDTHTHAHTHMQTHTHTHTHMQTHIRTSQTKAILRNQVFAC